MTFVSYAQNFEDVMLWRALKHVERGFYIDVGAWSPEADSVTRAFYERGWRGINIEPHPDFHEQLQKLRPDDRNLRLALGDRECTLTMHIVAESGLSTLDSAIADKHRKAGWTLHSQDVQVRTLADVWRQHVLPGQEVHFLKVDVEGFEQSVLQGADWVNNRPWIVIVEATLPVSQVESWAAWEPLLVAADYLICYADGLNRFYLARERISLLPAFKYPPNVFDEFTFWRIRDAETRAAQSEVRFAQTESRAAQAEAQLAELLNSKTWRLTAPLRWAIKRYRALQRMLK